MTMIRMAICQRLMRHYRVPVFSLLGAQPGIDLTVFAALHPSARSGLDAAGDRFRFVESPTRRIPILPGGFAHQAAQLAAVRSGAFDLVILPWDLHFASTVVPATGRARRRGVPVVLWGHGYSKRPGPRREQLRDWMGRRADGVLVYSHRVAGALRGRGFPDSRVFAAPNALDQATIQTARTDWLARPRELDRFRSEHGLDPMQTIIHVSRLLEENQPHLLIEVLARLRARRPGARLVFVGDGPARADLERRTREAGLSPQVIFAGEVFGHDEIAPWLLSATLLAYPTNIGLTLHHAFGFGVPVVTSDEPDRHNPEFEALEPGRSGLLFPPGDAAACADACESIMASETLRSELSAYARETVLERYTLPVMVQGFLETTVLVDGQSRSVQASI